MLEIGHADATALGLALADLEADVEGAGHLDGGTAALGVALGVVGVASGEEGTLGGNGDEEAGAGGELLDIEIAADFAGRDGAEGGRGDGLGGGYRAVGVGGLDCATGLEKDVLALGDFLEEGAGGGDADGAHEGGFGDADAGDLGRGGKAVAHVPLGDEGVEVDIPQEAEAGDDAGEAEGRRLDVEDVDLEEVAKLGALDVDGTGEGVDETEVDAGEVGVVGALSESGRRGRRGWSLRPLRRGRPRRRG